MTSLAYVFDVVTYACVSACASHLLRAPLTMTTNWRTCSSLTSVRAVLCSMPSRVLGCHGAVCVGAGVIEPTIAISGQFPWPRLFEKEGANVAASAAPKVRLQCIYGECVLVRGREGGWGTCACGAELL